MSQKKKKCFDVCNDNRFNKQMKINKKQIAGLKALYTEITRQNEQIKRMNILLHEREYLQQQYEQANLHKNKNKSINRNANINNYSNVNLNFRSNNNNNANSNNSGNSVGNNNNTRIDNTNANDNVSLPPTICWDSEGDKSKAIPQPRSIRHSKSQKSKPRTKLQSKKEIDDSTDSNPREGEATPPPQSIALSIQEGANSMNDIDQPNIESFNMNTISHVVPDELSSIQSPNNIPPIIDETESQVAGAINQATQSNIVPPINSNTQSQVIAPTAQGSESQLLLGGGTPLSTHSWIGCDLNDDCAIHNGEKVDELDLIQRSTSGLQGDELSKDGKQSTIEQILKYQEKLRNLLREWLRVDGSKQSLKKQLFKQLEEKFHHTTSILNYNLHKH